MQLDIGNALDSAATPGVSTDALDRLDDAVADAHETIAAGMSNARFGYASLNLPETTSATGIERAVDPIDADAVLTVGIGGSPLGAKTITAALGEANHYLLDTVDPEEPVTILAPVVAVLGAIGAVFKPGAALADSYLFRWIRSLLPHAEQAATDRGFYTTYTIRPEAEAVGTWQGSLAELEAPPRAHG